MQRHAIVMEVRGGRLENILRELDTARETIYRCYRELQEMGVLVIKEEPPESDGPSESNQDA